MKKINLNPYKAATILIPLIALILYLTKDIFIGLFSHLPTCPIYARYHVYCPACGNTRSVTALLHGDLLTALRFNIVPVILGIFAILGYIEIAFTGFGRRIYLLPRKLSYYIIVIILLILYLIIRNFIPYLTP